LKEIGKKSLEKRGFRLSIVVPMYNEEEVCEEFFRRILPILEDVTDDFEVVCVNDGSTDKTQYILSVAHQSDARVKVVNLSRNFGKEYALTAGLNLASGDAVIPIDADLQDPPELIPIMVSHWLDGYRSVIAVRKDRLSDTYIKRTTAKWFYKVIGKLADTRIPANSGDYRLMDRTIIEALKQLPERNRFLKGLYSWVGFDQKYIEYKRERRAAGNSKWGYWSLWNFALDGILSFSTLPLRIWSYLGVTVTCLSAIYGSFIVIRTLVYGIELPGYASILTVVLFLGGINMLGLGILGEYLGRVFVEVKNRPIYLIESTLGIEDR
jgi:glycosyltransferase involved in cell wall biosynthesis